RCRSARRFRGTGDVPSPGRHVGCVGMHRRQSMSVSHRSFVIALAFVVAVGAILARPAPAAAQDATTKLGRGLAGMTTGVLELPGNIKAETEEDGARGIPIGLAKGIGMVIAREVVGVYEFVSAPLPVPHGYQPILEPEFPWDYFKTT